MGKVKVIFKKKRLYNDVMREVGEIVEMYKADVKGYLEFGVVEYYIESKSINIETLKYSELQALCKKHKIPAVGKQEDLILRLNEKIS